LIQISHILLFTFVAVSDWRSIIRQSEPIMYLMEASPTVSLIRQIWGSAPGPRWGLGPPDPRYRLALPRSPSHYRARHNPPSFFRFPRTWGGARIVPARYISVPASVRIAMYWHVPISVYLNNSAETCRLRQLSKLIYNCSRMSTQCRQYLNCAIRQIVYLGMSCCFSAEPDLVSSAVYQRVAGDATSPHYHLRSTGRERTSTARRHRRARCRVCHSQRGQSLVSTWSVFSLNVVSL